MSEHGTENDAAWNPHWNYAKGEPRSVCRCPDGAYEGARLATSHANSGRPTASGHRCGTNEG